MQKQQSLFSSRDEGAKVVDRYRGRRQVPAGDSWGSPWLQFHLVQSHKIWSQRSACKRISPPQTSQAGKHAWTLLHHHHHPGALQFHSPWSKKPQYHWLYPHSLVYNCRHQPSHKTPVAFHSWHSTWHLPQSELLPSWLAMAYEDVIWCCGWKTWTLQPPYRKIPSLKYPWRVIYWMQVWKSSKGLVAFGKLDGNWSSIFEALRVERTPDAVWEACKKKKMQLVLWSAAQPLLWMEKKRMSVRLPRNSVFENLTPGLFNLRQVQPMAKPRIINFDSAIGFACSQVKVFIELDFFVGWGDQVGWDDIQNLD